MSETMCPRLPGRVVTPRSETCFRLRNERIEDREVDNRLDKIDFADVEKDAKSVAGFARQFRVGLNNVQVRPAAKTVSKWRPPKSLISRRIWSG